MSVRRWRRTLAGGHISNRWVVDIAFKRPDGTEKRIRRFPRVQTRAAAERLERELMNELEESGADKPQHMPAAIPAPVPSLSQFWPEYVRVHVVPNNKPSEQEAKRTIYANHLQAIFGNVRLDAICSRDIEQYKAHKFSELGYAAKTVNNHLAVLRGALNVAKRWAIIQSVPSYSELRAKPTPVRVLSLEEAAKLAAAAKEPWRTMIQLALNTGLRIGELLGLQWSDINLKSRVLIVRTNIWRNHIGTPKSGRNREIPLNFAALKSLADHPRQLAPWVFSRASGTHLSNALCRRPLHRACKLANVRVLQWHVLRHTFASHLVANGVPLRAVQALLGHASYATTERYAHLLPQATQDAVALLHFP